jgi:hypothetical protein
LPDLDIAQKIHLRETVFAVRPESACQDCGGYHIGVCPRIKRLVLVGEGQAVGNRIEVEYWKTWDDSHVIYPEDAWEDQE